MRRSSRWQRGLDATRSKDEIDLLKPEGEMTINKLRAAYTNMNEDEDEGGRDDDRRVESDVRQHERGQGRGRGRGGEGLK